MPTSRSHLTGPHVPASGCVSVWAICENARAIFSDKRLCVCIAVIRSLAVKSNYGQFSYKYGL